LEFLIHSKKGGINEGVLPKLFKTFSNQFSSKNFKVWVKGVNLKGEKVLEMVRPGKGLLRSIR